MKKLLFKTFILIFLFLSFSLQTFALAGWAEKNSDFIYNDYATLHWGHPSDACPKNPTQYCFYLKGNNDLKNPIDESLQKISIPESSQQSIVMTKDNVNENWFIVDLKSDGIVLKTSNFSKALRKWKSFGLQRPEFADKTNLLSHFKETDESKLINFKQESSLFMLFLLILSFLSIPISCIFAILVAILHYFKYAKKLALRSFFIYPQCLLFLLALENLGIHTLISSDPKYLSVQSWYNLTLLITIILLYVLYKKRLLKILVIYPSAIGFYISLFMFIVNKEI